MTRSQMLLLAALAIPAAASAQNTCKPDADTPEAKLLAYFAGPLAFATMPTVVTLTQGQIAVAGELTWLPTPPTSLERSSGACFGYNKSENSDLAPAFPRPRIAVGLGNGLVLDASWIPPVTVADATPYLFGAGISWTPERKWLSGTTSLTLRASSTFGGVNGPITCPRSALSTSGDCNGPEPSDDRYNPNVRSLEGVLHGGATRWRWHAGAGVNATASELKVHFVASNGAVDNNRVEIDLMRPVVLGGLALQVRPTLALSAQVYSVPGDATTARLGFAWRAR